VKSTFFEKIENHIAKGPGFKSFPGAGEFIRKLKRSEECRIAIATGGWEKSARMKLESAGIDHKGVSLFSSDQSHIRTEIMKNALASLGEEINEIYYYGDATWDRTAAKELGWNFVPVGKRLKGIEEYQFQDIINFFPKMEKKVDNKEN
jgi:FMN phosphatase YigB (HAD superfamily)